MSWCDYCNNQGWVECDCGGDMRVCDNYGEVECPMCDGEGGDSDLDDEYEDA